LIMDDDDDVRELFKISLEKLGCDVLLASDGNEAISLYRENRKDRVKIDVMILDLSIPNGLGGNETARKMRLLDQDIRLIVSSGYTEGPEMTSFKEHGFNAAIEKNFNRENIKRVLINVLTDKK